MDFAIGAVITGVIVYVALLFGCAMLGAIENQVSLSTDQQADLENTASETIGWFTFIVNFPGREAVAVLAAIGGGFGALGAAGHSRRG